MSAYILRFKDGTKNGNIRHRAQPITCNPSSSSSYVVTPSSSTLQQWPHHLPSRAVCPGKHARDASASNTYNTTPHDSSNATRPDSSQQPPPSAPPRRTPYGPEMYHLHKTSRGISAQLLAPLSEWLSALRLSLGPSHSTRLG